jgi:hypothetical protein
VSGDGRDGRRGVFGDARATVSPPGERRVELGTGIALGRGGGAWCW